MPFRSRDDLDWKNHITVARQRKIQGPHLCWPFCFLTTIRNTPSLKDHPTGGTYSIKMQRKRGPQESRMPAKSSGFIFVHLQGGRGGWTPLPLLGFLTDCLQGWLRCSWKRPSPRSAVPAPRAAATKVGANITRIANISHHRPIQLQQLPCTGPSPLVWTLQLATNVPIKFVNALNLMYIVIDALK